VRIDHCREYNEDYSDFRIQVAVAGQKSVNCVVLRMAAGAADRSIIEYPTPAKNSDVVVVRKIQRFDAVLTCGRL
jgi:hypothetical protein